MAFSAVMYDIVLAAKLKILSEMEIYLRVRVNKTNRAGQDVCPAFSLQF